MLKHILIKETLVFQLSVLEALQNNSNEQVQEYKVYEDVEAIKEELAFNAWSTTHCLIVCLYIIFIGWVLFTLEVDIMIL